MRRSASSTPRPLVESVEVLGQRPDGGFALGRREKRRNGGQPDAVAAELLDLHAETRRASRACCLQRLALRRRQLHQDRRQQPLALHPAGRQPLHHLLEQHPLVRDVLVDDGDPFIVDGNDEGVAELTERDHRPDVGGLDRGSRAWASSGVRGVDVRN